MLCKWAQPCMIIFNSVIECSGSIKMRDISDNIANYQLLKKPLFYKVTSILKCTEVFLRIVYRQLRTYFKFYGCVLIMPFKSQRQCLFR
jgi:hypothetical protein